MVHSLRITTTDTSPAQALIPVAELFLQQGDVTVCCDGASATLWGRLGESHTPTNGSLNFSGIYEKFSPERKPSFQLTGASANSELEYDALYYANSMSVKTAVYVDIDGAHRRFQKSIDFVDIFLASTKSVHMEILRDYPHATVHVVGTPNAKIVKTNKQTVSAIQANGFSEGTVVTWAAGGTLSDLQLTVDCLMSHMRDCALVMGLHPDPAKVAGIDDIMQITKPLRDAGRLLWDPSDNNSSLNIPGNTAEKGLASSVTVGASSLVLDEIAYNGGKVASVVNKETLQAFARVCPEVPEFPCVSAGRSVPISKSCDLRSLVFPDITNVRGTMIQYSAKAVLEALGF